MVGCIAHCWRGLKLFGRPPLGTTAGVVVGLMIYRRLGQGNVVVVLLLVVFCALLKLVHQKCLFFAGKIML